MKRILFLALAVIVIVSCNNPVKKKQVESEKDETKVENLTTTPNYCGTYKGTLPAADCEGIETTLTINQDKTYNLLSVYKGVKDGTFETNGTYNIVNETLIELVTPSSGDKTYYKILDDSKIILSDEQGTVNDGALAELYILKK